MRKATFKTNQTSPFYRTVNSRVKTFFQSANKSPHANGFMIAKLVACLTLFAGLYVLIIAGNLPVALLIPVVPGFGIASAFVGFNIAHDAAHGALFASRRLNGWFAYTFELIGISSYIWKLKHNRIHHHHPNLQQGDFDIEAAPFLRLSPADKWRPYHRYQHLYAPVVYLLFSLSLVLFDDCKIMFRVKRSTIDGKDHPVRQVIFFILAKLAYVFAMLVVPMLVMPYTPGQIVAGFLLMHTTLSLVLAFVLIPAHLFEQTQYFEKNKDGTIDEDWAVYQLKTTLDYARKSRLCNLLFGGFNINVVHHLFPKICHVHLVQVSDIIQQTAAEFGIPYNEAGMWQAVRSHFTALRMLGHNQPFT